jgi:hypothetical protein
MLEGAGDGVCGDCKVRSGAKSLEKPLKWRGGSSDTIFVGRCIRNSPFALKDEFRI